MVFAFSSKSIIIIIIIIIIMKTTNKLQFNYLIILFLLTVGLTKSAAQIKISPGNNFENLAYKKIGKGECSISDGILVSRDAYASFGNAEWQNYRMSFARQQEGYTSGSAFGHASGQVARQSEFDEVLRMILDEMRKDPECGFIHEDDDVHSNYSFNRTFRKSSENRARQLGVETSVQDATNRWRGDARARGQVVKRKSQREHYSHALFLMPETWRYGYCM